MITNNTNEELDNEFIPDTDGLEKEDIQNGTIQEPFDPNEIDVITQNRTLDLLITRLREGELDLTPDFQRRANLWTKQRKSSLIESMLLKIPIPSFYISEDKEGDYAVVDGLQRFCSISHFVDVAALNQAVNSKLDPLRLTELDSLKELNGKSFDELPRLLQRRINETELTLHIIRPSTPEKVKFNIFSRINKGGLPLTSQEIRNASMGGEWRNYIRQMSESDAFISSTEGKIKKDRMQDMELILRFIALYSLDEAMRPNDQNLDDFLNDFILNKCNQWSNNEWNEVSEAFKFSMNAAPKIFGKHAFRKYIATDSKRRPINRGLFETESVVIAKRKQNEINILADRTKDVLSKMYEYYDRDSEFYNALLYATGKGSSSNIRVKTINRIFDEVINA